MNWARAIAGVLVLWSSTAGGATLKWKANSDPDLAGYRVYHCSLQPCTPESGNASLLVTLGTGTSFNLGTPPVTQYYFITAYDFANNESDESNLATVTPAGSPPPPPASVVPITFDAASSSATGNTTNRISWSHTVGIGTNRFLAVCTQARDRAGRYYGVVTTVTANGFPLRKVRADVGFNGGISFRTELWYLVNPGVGTHTIAVTWTEALSDYGVGSATSYFGVDQDTPIDAIAGSGGTGTTLSTAITTVANHALITDCALGQASPLAVNAGQTTRVNRLTMGTPDSVGVSTMNDKAVAGSERMDWTQGKAEIWVISAVSLRPAH
jgi:hypothetical protein